jgi:pimeloyl-ACP methyl ester carboxylesterase
MELEIITRTPQTSPKNTPLLFVHGAWHAAWCWEEHFLPYFAKQGYHAHALSLRGHGNSACNKRFSLVRITDYVADLSQVVRKLPEMPVLVGHSMGGLVVQKYLEEHNAPAAVLLAAVPTNGVLRTTLRIAVRNPLAFLKANLTWSLYPIIGKSEFAQQAFFSENILPEKLNSYFHRMQDESYLAFLDMMIFKLPKPERVNTDMLVMGAGNDTIFYPAEINATAKAYHTEAEMFPDMAHDMMLEDNWQAVADRIISWLNQKGIK